MSDKELTTIQISKKLREQLKRLGRMGETYEDVIRRLVAMATKKDEVNEK